MSQGIRFSQEGVPLKRAADYQRVVDERWRVMEVLEEVDVRVNVPEIPGNSGTWVEMTPIYYHGLNYEPAFFASMTNASNDAVQMNAPKGIVADKEWIYFYRNIGVYNGSANPSPAFNDTIELTVYTLPLTSPYTAETEIPRGGATRESKYGIKFLDDTGQSRITDSSPLGFSADSQKKTLAVHKHGTYYVSDYLNDRAYITAIDTATNQFTFQVDTSQNNPLSNIDWMTTGAVIDTYNPQDFSTLPAPLAFNTDYYLIMDSNTKFRLATSLANAQAGNAIDITSTGSLPATIRRKANEDDFGFAHGVGYPPSFLFAAIRNFTGTALPPYKGGGPGVGTKLQTRYIAPLSPFAYTPITSATATRLNLGGVQAPPQGEYAYIIFKDPVELAQ